MADIFPSAVFLLLLFSGSILHFASSEDESDEKFISNMKRVRDKIFKDYDKTVRPQALHNNKTTLHLDMAPLYVIDLDEEKSLFSMDCWFGLSWIDQRLQWNASLFEDIYHLTLGPHEVWQPDITVNNAHRSDIEPLKNTLLYLHSNGYIYWVPAAYVTTYCDVTTPLVSYPYDTQECNITIGCWTYDGCWHFDFDISDNHSMYWKYFSNTNPRWEINTKDSKMFKAFDMCVDCKEPFVKIDIKIVLKRRPPAQIQVVWAPSIIVMILTLTMFWIPSDSGRKITLGASLLIILTALTIYCMAYTESPVASQLSVSFVEATMIAVSSAVLLEIVIINLARLNTQRKPPEFLVGLLSGRVGTYIGVWAPGDKIRENEDAETEKVDPVTTQEWFMVATGCDRVLFVIYIVVFSAIHQV